MIPIRDSIATQSRPFVNWLIIGLNLGAFGYEISLAPDRIEGLIYQWGAVPAAFDPRAAGLSGAVASLPTLFTCLFLHAGPGHLLFNMLYLWVFGDNVEERLGHAKYLLFYLACGIVASLTQIFFSPGSEIPLIGASGAIGGVMGAYLLAFPHARVLTLFWFLIIVRFIWIPAVAYLGLWFVLQLYQAVAESGAGRGGVAFWAHAGGFAAGMALLVAMGGRGPKDGTGRRRSNDPAKVIEVRGS